MSNPHITEATRWIRVAENVRPGSGIEDTHLAFAQAEALLAIAYELRTANLLTRFIANPVPQEISERLEP